VFGGLRGPLEKIFSDNNEHVFLVVGCPSSGATDHHHDLHVFMALLIDRLIPLMVDVQVELVM